MKINLLPKEYRPQPAISLPRLAFVLFYIFTLFGMAVWMVSDWTYSNKITQDIAKVDQDILLYGEQYQNVITLEKQQAEIRRKWDEIATILAPFVKVDRCLNEITMPLPNNVWIKSLSIDGVGHVTIDGRSDRMRAVAMYMIDIEISPAFLNTNLQVIDNTTSNGVGDVFGYKLTFDIDKAGLANE